MIDKLSSTLRRLWESACQDTPRRDSCRVVDGEFILTVTGNKDTWNDITKAAGVPEHADQIIEENTLTCRWPSHADAIFGPGGLVAGALPGYEMRLPQLHMARLVQRSIEMREPAVIEGPTGTGKCLHGDTLITLADGTQRPIREIAGHERSYITQVSDRLKVQHAQVYRCWHSGRKQVFRLTTRLGREIEASQDHRFMAVGDEGVVWKRLGDLRLGDRIAVARKARAPFNPIEMSGHEICFLAYMIADGSCTNARRSGSVQYTKADPEIIQDLEYAVSRMDNLQINKIPAKKYHYGISRQVARVGMEWKRNSAITLLEKTGLAGKDAYGKFVPDCIFRLPSHQLALFLGRLFSGDGTVDAQRRVVEYYSVSRQLVDQVQHLLLRFGVVSKVVRKNGRYQNERHLSWRLTVSGATDLKPFCEHIGPHFLGEKFTRLEEVASTLTEPNPNYNVIPKAIMPVIESAMEDVGLSKKQARHQHGVNIRTGHKGISRNKMAVLADVCESPSLWLLAHSDIYWDEIMAIEPGDIADTYDIEMAAPPNFLANDFVVHNSIAYAAICMAMDKTVVISTSNKALQTQLYTKDIPFLQTLFPGKKLAMVQGKNNYACRTKVEDISAGGYTIDGPLLNWYHATDTGNVEEIPFHVEWQDLRDVTVDNYCTGKLCSRYHDCFYYEAKAKRQDADVLVCNHMLLALDHLYPGAGILPPVDVVVVDEAHKLADYVRNAVGGEFGLDTINRRIALAEKYDVSTSMAEDAHRSFNVAVLDRVGDSPDREIGIAKDDEMVEGIDLAMALYGVAGEIWHEGDLAENGPDIKRQRDAESIYRLADTVNIVSQPTRDGYVRWIEQNDGQLTLKHVPFDVSDWIGEMAGFFRREDKQETLEHTHCSRCGRRLTADTVAVLEGFPYGPDCIRHVDPFGDAERMPLVDWLALDHEPVDPVGRTPDPTPVIFTSATLAAPDLKAFLREAGLPDALQMVAASPFDYEANALLYIPPGAAPAPNKASYRGWLVDELARLVYASKGGAFLLFTSYANMRHCSQFLRFDFEQAGYQVFVQGQLPKLEISKRFMACDNGVLFATKSFWEGVSIDGRALRLVCIDKMPFEPPTPLNSAQETALRQWAREQGMTDKEAEWYPFEALRVPRMIIDLKQGSGRLIRTRTDYGVIAIMDSRLRSAQYARRLVLPALPPATRAHDVYQVSNFFAEHADADKRKVADLEPVERFGVQALRDPENPFSDLLEVG